MDIDWYVENEKPKAKAKTQDYSRMTLGEMLSHENEAIRRNAVGILKQLQQKKSA